MSTSNSAGNSSKAEEGGEAATAVAQTGDGWRRLVPRRQDGVEARSEGGERVQLRRRRPARGGVRGWLDRKLGRSVFIQVELDARGAFFWGLINGIDTLETIEERMRERFGFEREASREATLRFALLLARRGLIGLG
ncbi:MAG TPA: PqqD family protein [Candidatus Sumerlaeota bacterium]|nr:PqqD family protein [Candidatus Sumerlaeota bacterium]HPK02234.1 PqqD family protein [Candidatus Sumerlaeota bacterium]